MEQTSNVVMSMLQTMASQAAGIPKPGKTEGDELSDFYKLLEEKSQEKDPLMEQPAKTESKPQTAAPKKDKAPAQKQENPLEQAKKLAEQGAWFSQPNIAMVQIDPETGESIVHQPGEYILAHLGEQTEIIPTTGLEPWEQLQLQELMEGMGPTQVIDVTDPAADAILEATAPGADNSPAAMLEKVTDQQLGQEVQQAVEQVQPRESEDEGDSMMELTAGDQAPQQLFHDVKAAPVKVGETELPQQIDEADVVKQVENQVAQVIERGDSTVTVRLNPENLGEVTVQVSMKSGSILAVAISARNDDTRALLERHAANLQELLGSRVRETVEVDIQRGQESQQRQQNYDGHNGHAQDGQEQQQRRSRREHTSSQDFMQQLRLGLIPVDGED